jgi:AcrR family transcriptional regulator
MLVRDADLTTTARIRNAALEGFATRGAAATSIRDVADAAGVSAGLVQHHFGTKAGLRAAVDEYVVAVAVDAFSDVDALVEDPIRDLGDRVAAVVRDHPTALLYVARSVAEGDEAALALFDRFVALAREQWQRLADAGRVHDDVDLDWAALHIVVFNLGTVLFEAAISRSLSGPFSSPREIERWNVAARDLFERGLLRASGG